MPTPTGGIHREGAFLSHVRSGVGEACAQKQGLCSPQEQASLCFPAQDTGRTSARGPGEPPAQISVVGGLGSCALSRTGVARAGPGVRERGLGCGNHATPAGDWSPPRSLGGCHAPSLLSVGSDPKEQMSHVPGWQCQESGLAHGSQHPRVPASSPAGGGACDCQPQSLLRGLCAARAGQGRGPGLPQREEGVQTVLYLLTCGGDGPWP